MQFKRQRSKIFEECKEYLEKYEGTYWVKKTINKQHLKVSSDGWRFHLICHRNDRGLSLFINSDDHDEHVKNDQFTTAPNQISTVTETQLSQRKRRGSPPKKVVNTTKTTQAFTPEKTGTANTNTRKSTGNQNKTK